MPLFNRVWFNVSGTPGTGAVTVGTAVGGYQTPAGASVPNGNVCSYTAVDGLAWETGKTTYTVSGTSCSRSLLESSTGSLLNLSSTATMAFQAIAEDMTIATEAQAEAGTDNAAIMTAQAVAQSIAANARPFSNIAGRNGGFEVWQAGTSISFAGSTVGYTADGWYLLANASQATTISRQAGNTNGSSYSCRVQRNAGQTGTGVYIFGFPLDVDELKKMAGQSAILQFNVSTGANWSPSSGTLNYAVYTGTGSPAKQYLGTYTGPVTAISGSINLAQSAAAATIFSSIVAIAANIGQSEIQFTWTPVGAAGANDWLQIDDVDLRTVPAGISAIKPAFERSDFIWDLHRCQRHLDLSYDYGTAPGSATISGIGGGISFARTGAPANISFPVHIAFTVPMRAVPAISYWDHAGNVSMTSDGSNNSYVANIGASTIQLITTKSFQAYSAIGFSTYLHYLADARI